jgi:hypothetical protein
MGSRLNPHDINRIFDHKIQHKEFNFHGDKTNKKGMKGEEGEEKNSLLSSKFELMFTLFQLEEKKYKGEERNIMNVLK